jgi:tetratricopeptide (TPR) repeat protein
VFDDIPQIQQNDKIRLASLSLDGLRRAALESSVRGRPVSYITLALNYWWGEYDVVGYRVVNIAIHVVNAWLVYAFVFLTIRQYRATAGDAAGWVNDAQTRWMALLSASLFAFHPIQIQSVTYIVQRMNSLATLFYLAALLLYIVGRHRSGWGLRGSLWLAGLVFWLISLGCKQITITLPAVVLMYEWYFFQNLSRRWLRVGLWMGGAVLVLLAVVTLLQFSAVGQVFNAYRGREFTLIERLMTQPRVLGVYAGLTLWPMPSRFNLLHEMAFSKNLLSPWTTLPALAGLLAYAALGVVMARYQRLVSFCLLWPLIHLAVESSILPIELIYEHRMYLPMVGPAMLAAWCLARLLLERPASDRWILFVVLVALLGTATHFRNRVWNDPVLFWSDVVEKSPRNVRAYVNRASAYVDRSDLRRALEDYNAAYAINPTNDAALLGRGLALVKSGKPADALKDFTEAANRTKDNPTRAIAYRQRGDAHVALQQDGLAIESYTLALQWKPDDFSSRYNRGNVYRRLGQYSSAIKDYKEVIRRNPMIAPPYNNLAIVLATCDIPSLRDPQQAIEYAKKACALTEEQDWNFLTTLAETYAVNEEFVEAAEAQGKAAMVAPADMRRSLERRQEIYAAKAKLATEEKK